ncbi:DUF1904 family protein [Aerococcaceae bacterium zg-ZJ1578]|uniref:2-hydroxymuconate tautomerase n=1 Tax=Aerococcaceae TaxID=186827 RepID=UPI0013B6FF27|nr:MULTISPECIES: 2-hydroxymuconate tautomerase [unclassified Facklamia]MBK0348040.1 DUF1904 family protein [Aerococcaceae bacterium zg-1578]MBR7926777.1 DUF1904 family protein [Aerococcaceae bacterium zg-ZUI334]MBS4461722.1 DUF1904 family protein [Aerococcaceae bacterium zg-B36]QQD65354.1 DUF1904 family protein [Aerococcaceae bacterium zg-252]NEW64010.1 DUF1904 family protein [Facklamia sp. 252]
MPFVHIELLEGRSQEVKEKIAQEIRETISKHANAPKENIHIIFQDMKKENYFRPEKESN